MQKERRLFSRRSFPFLRKITGRRHYFAVICASTRSRKRRAKSAAACSFLIKPSASFSISPKTRASIPVRRNNFFNAVLIKILSFSEVFICFAVKVLRQSGEKTARGITPLFRCVDYYTTLFFFVKSLLPLFYGFL